MIAVERSEIACNVMCDVSRNDRYFMAPLNMFLP